MHQEMFRRALHFYHPRKRQKTYEFLMFLGGIEMERPL